MSDKFFTDQKGRDHRTAMKLDLEQVRSFFESKGFDVKDLSQKWRNVYGKLQKNREIFFLKLASTPGIGHRTYNEATFNKQLLSVLTGNNWTVPKVIAEGEYNGLYYYLSEFIDWPLLLPQKTAPDKNFDARLPEVVAINKFLLNQSDFIMPRDDEHEGKPLANRIQLYYQRWEDFYNDVKEFDLKQLLDTVKTIDKTFAKALNHCDFAPWHMMRSDNKLVLFDAEHASNYNPRYYDVCYFYHRLYTVGTGADSAKKYFNLFRDSLDSRERQQFDDAVKPILAARIIGGFWDEKNSKNKVPDYSIHNQIKQEYLASEHY
jgi:hypothetical protein